MTQVSSDDVRHLAQLSSLGLSDDEVEILRQDLDNILGYISQLDELSVDNIEPTYQVTGLENIWRDDEVEVSEIDPHELVWLAPESMNDQVKVPKVL